jgi:hypothetical protein
MDSLSADNATSVRGDAVLGGLSSNVNYSAARSRAIDHPGIGDRLGPERVIGMPRNR